MISQSIRRVISITPFVKSPEDLSKRSSTSQDMPADIDDGSDSMINLMLVVLGIVFFALILVSILFVFRRVRRNRQLQGHTLPSYYDAAGSVKNPRGLTIETTHPNGRSSVLVIGRDGQPMLPNPNSPPHSPDNVPEIRITFPDEQDAQGRHQSGRVLVVRVGENATVGLEPVQEEQLPAYEKDAKAGFYSVDMDQIGGLKEKDRNLFQ
ncbi:hypothetical protein CC79DRAFT_8054 [Sarocladium strictum]|jgi:hypothetical protein